MKIFHHNHDRPIPACISSQRRDERLLAAFACGVGHCIVEGPPFTGLRQIEEVIEVHELLGLDDARRDDPLDGDASLGAVRGGRQAKQAADDGSHRILTFADSEIQHETTMDLKPLRLREAAHLVDKPRLADACIATNIYDMARSPGETRANNPLELLELCLSSDETAAAGGQWLRRAV